MDAITGRRPRKAISPLIEFLAQAAEIPLNRFTHQHTHAPWNSSFSRDTDANKGPTHSAAEPTPTRLRVPVNYLRYCPECIEEDLKFWNFSYWRKSHHFPGVEWCTKHFQPLRSTDFTTILPCYSAPRFDKFHSRPSWGKRGGERKSLYRRYADILFSIIDTPVPFTRSQVVCALNARGAAVGICRSEGAEGTRLSDLAYRRYDFGWISSIVPMIDRNDKRLFEFALNRAFRYSWKCTPETYVFALALLYDDADTAVFDIMNAPRSRTLP